MPSTAETVDKFLLQLPKGAKERLKVIAKAQNQNLSDFIRDAITEQLKRLDITDLDLTVPDTGANLRKPPRA